MVFSSRMVSEVVQPFWAAFERGEFITGAAEGVGSYRVQDKRTPISRPSLLDSLDRVSVARLGSTPRPLRRHRGCRERHGAL
jgi:hypothetical protein